MTYMIEYKLKDDAKPWIKCSFTMSGKPQLQVIARKLAREYGWLGFRIRTIDMNQNIRQFRAEAQKIKETLDFLVNKLGAVKIDRYGKDAYRIQSPQGEIDLYLDIDDDTDFRSVWLHCHTHSSFKVNGVKHHKHHSCLFQEHQPRHKNARRCCANACTYIIKSHLRLMGVKV